MKESLPWDARGEGSVLIGWAFIVSGNKLHQEDNLPHIKINWKPEDEDLPMQASALNDYLTANYSRDRMSTMSNSPGKKEAKMPTVAPSRRANYSGHSGTKFSDEPQIIPVKFREPVARAAHGKHDPTCKRCGSDAVAWSVSKKTGKYYLTESFLQLGEKFTGRLEFHSKYCGHPELHMEMQIQYGVEAEQGRN